MKIKVISVYVDDQSKALRFYTEVLGFAKKTDFSQGPYRWLTVASPEEPNGTELQLALNSNPAAKAYQQAMFQQGQPAAMFFTDDVDGSLGTVGTTVKLTTVRAPKPQVSETTVTRADAPKVLEYNWGDKDIRWELEAFGSGTRLTLWHNIDRGFISMGAAGWHICFDVLDRLLIGTPLGRIVGAEAMKFDWPRLNSEYAQQFGIETPSLRLRKQAQENEEAKQIQQALMPTEITQIAGLENSWHWR